MHTCMVHSCSLMTSHICDFAHHSEMCPHGFSAVWRIVSVCRTRHACTEVVIQACVLCYPMWGWKMFYQRQIVAFICKIHGTLCYTQVCITYCSDNGFDTNEHTHTHIKQTLKSQVLLLYVMFITPRYLKVFNEWKMKYNVMFFMRVVWQGRPLSEIKWVYPLESWLY